MNTPPTSTGGRALAVVALAAGAVAWTAGAGSAQTTRSPWSYDQNVQLTYEFDDNVAEEVVDPVHAQVAKIQYLGDLSWAGGDQRLAFSYAGGFKRHFDPERLPLVEFEPDGDVVDGGSQDVPSQFIHQGSLEYRRRLADALAVRGRIGAKARHWTGKLPFVNEDGFTLYSGEVGAIVDLQPLEPSNPVHLEVSGRYSDIEFENVDPFFGNWAMGGDVALSKGFGASVDARVVYSFDRIRYPGRAVLEQGDQPLNITSPNRPRQEDRVHEVGAEIEWFGPVTILAEYGFRFNDSNSFGFENFSHNVGIQVLRHLPWGMLVHAYGQVQVRTYTEPVFVLPAGSLDIGEPEDNVVLLRVVKDLTEKYSVEARYARYRNESITLNDYYSKNIWSVGVTLRP